MTKINSFRDLLVWQKGLDLAIRLYKVVRRFPKLDQMVLAQQIRKSALSIPSNIAEGKARRSTAGYISDTEELGRMLGGLIGSLERNRH
jgi:23S rRNA-intervening sequence protein